MQNVIRNTLNVCQGPNRGLKVTPRGPPTPLSDNCHYFFILFLNPPLNGASHQKKLTNFEQHPVKQPELCKK